MAGRDAAMCFLDAYYINIYLFVYSIIIILLLLLLLLLSSSSSYASSGKVLHINSNSGKTRSYEDCHTVQCGKEGDTREEALGRRRMNEARR